MIIHHFNRNEAYELYEQNRTFYIKGDTLKHTQGKPDLHTALWDLIDWIRTICFTNLTDEDCNIIQRLSRSEKELNRETIMNVVCGKKINRVFYEHTYDLLYYSYVGNSEKFVVLNNERNFFIYEEIIQLMRFANLKVSDELQRRN